MDSHSDDDDGDDDNEHNNGNDDFQDESIPDHRESHDKVNFFGSFYLYAGFGSEAKCTRQGHNEYCFIVLLGHHLIRKRDFLRKTRILIQLWCVY